MTKSDFFNNDSICIFTDSSFKKTNYGDSSAIGITAPAYCVFHCDNCIEQGFSILHNSTSQQGELYALRLGVEASAKYKNYPHIRIFADNMNAVMSIREWIFNWVQKQNSGIHVLGETGSIHNQSFIMNIINTIIYNNIYIELYHVKGHVNIRKKDDIIYSKELFKRSNPFVGQVDDSLIYQLALGNNTVDEYSTAMLKIHFKDPKMMDAVSFGYMPFDMENYSKLINKKSNYDNENRKI